MTAVALMTDYLPAGTPAALRQLAWGASWRWRHAHLSSWRTGGGFRREAMRLAVKSVALHGVVCLPCRSA